MATRRPPAPTVTSAPPALLLREVEVAGALVDVRIADGQVREVGAGLRRASGDEELGGAGGALLPGLHDHHLHLRAAAAARSSVDCGPAAVGDAGALQAALAEAPSQGGWIRGTGYHESVAGDLDRDRLDELRGDVPVRLQHASGLRWVVNSAGLRALGLEPSAPAELPAGVERDAGGRLTGRLVRVDDWLHERLGGPAPSLEGLSQELAGLGITGVTDATARNSAADLAALSAARARGELLQDLLVLGQPSLPAADPATGAVKIVLDEPALPELDDLSAAIAAAHAERRAVAIHAVTRAVLALAVAAFRSAGSQAGDRIEHASVCPPELADALAELGLTVVTQPQLVADRGDRYLREVDPDDQPWLYPCGLLEQRGVGLAAGSDAPYGSPDPWQGIDAAMRRRTAEGARLGSEHALPARRALALYLTPLRHPEGPPRTVRAGAPAELCLLRVGLETALAEPTVELVRCTLLGGRLVTPSGGSV